jgi:hypothetical protein
MDLYTRRQLRKIRGVGPRRVSETEVIELPKFAG